MWRVDQICGCVASRGCLVPRDVMRAWPACESCGLKRNTYNRVKRKKKSLQWIHKKEKKKLGEKKSGVTKMRAKKSEVDKKKWVKNLYIVQR